MLGKKPARKNRFKKKRRNRRGQWLRRLLGGAKLLAVIVVVLAASALFMAGYAAVTRSVYFRTKAITVDGQARLTETALLTQAQLKTGDNLLAVNLGLVRKRLLAHPWIETARVTREIPERIHITIKEHTPLAVVDLGRQFLLNDQGRIFKELQPSDPQHFPLVTGIVYSDISLGRNALTPAMAAVVKVLHLSSAKNSAIPYDDIRGIHHDQEIGLAMRLGENQRTIKMGLAPYEDKYRRLKQLLPHIRRNSKWRQFDTIDVNNPNRIIVKLGRGANKDA